MIEKDDCQKLLDYLRVPAKESKDMIESDTTFSSLVQHLREAGKVSFDDITHLMTACSEKGLSKLVAVLTVFQQAQDSKFTKKVLKDQLKALEDKRQELSYKLSESEDEKQQLTGRLKASEEERQQFKDTLKATEEERQQLTGRLKTTEEERQQFKDTLKQQRKKDNS
ncbi:glycosyl transferase GT2 family [Apostichopus japonicus]|uniref:Glycosyl transferase GT2 family n=1 Tax=Stichopus japonicus TaxID=307972 RepID=A0A2G8KQD8_STIJA|nr:glycosyl transferase GT2 family [Apostichopus japonicus]